MATSTSEKIKLRSDQKPEEWRSVFEKHKSVIGTDGVFKKIARSIERGWGSLGLRERQEILEEVETLITKLTDYHEAYKNLKGMAGRRFYFEDPQKLRESTGEADMREKILHDALIDAINILSRKMKATGLDNSWRGDDEIYGLTPEAAREKPKLWMLKLFKERT